MSLFCHSGVDIIKPQSRENTTLTSTKYEKTERSKGVIIMNTKKRILAIAGATVIAATAVTTAAVSAKTINADNNGTKIVVKNKTTDEIVKKDMSYNSKYNLDYIKIDDAKAGDYEIKVTDSKGNEKVTNFGFDADKGVTENIVIKCSRDSKSIDIVPFDGAMGEETYDVSLFISGENSGVNMGMIKVDDDTYYAVADDLDDGDYTAVVNNKGRDSEESKFGVSGDGTATSFIVKYSAKTNKLDVEAISFESSEAVMAVKNTETGKTIMRELKAADSGNFAGLADTSEGTYEISVITKDGVVDTFTTTSTTQTETFVELNPTTSQVTYFSM